MTFLWWSTTMFVSAGGGVVAGVLFNKPIRALLQKAPLVGKYF